MSVNVSDGAIRLGGSCGVDDAEPLLGLIGAHPGTPVDLSLCVHLHGAVLQVLLAFKPPLTGESPDEFTRGLVAAAVPWTPPACNGPE